MAGRGVAGGIWALLDLIEEHRAAFEYDWRTRFHLSLAAVPDDMGWAETVRMASILRRDPSSAIAASLEGWDNLISREALAILDLYDLTVAANTDPKKRPVLHPGRPFKIANPRETETLRGNTAGISPAQVRERLRGLGHSLPV